MFFAVSENLTGCIYFLVLTFYSCVSGADNVIVVACCLMNGVARQRKKLLSNALNNNETHTHIFISGFHTGYNEHNKVK